MERRVWGVVGALCCHVYVVEGASPFASNLDPMPAPCAHLNHVFTQLGNGAFLVW